MTVLDEQRLVVSLEARLNKYEKDMARGVKATNDNYKKMESRTKQFADNTEKTLGKSFGNLASKIESSFAPFMRGGAVFAGLSGAVLAIKQISNTIAEVDREASKAGVSAKTWQQWSHVAAATGASVDGITDALKEMNIRANEFALTGKGSGAEWFDRLGYSAEEVGRKLQDPNRFLDEIIGKIQKLDRAAQTRALDEMFGGTGAEQLAKVLGLSVEEIWRLRSEAAVFTEEQIEAAKKIDAQFDTMWRNFMVRAKQAAIEGVGVAEKIYRALNGEYLPGYDRMKKAEAYYKSDEFKLEQAKKQREKLIEQIKDLETDPLDLPMREYDLERLREKLQDVEQEIIALGGGSDQLKGALSELSAMTQRAGGSFDTTASQAANFKSALADLKSMVPELKAELDELGKLEAVDAAFGKALSNASNLDELISAGNIAARAKSIAKYGSHKNMLDLIGAAEGTDKGRGYNETLDYGRWTGGAVNLTKMTLNEILALQSRMRTPENRALYGNGAGSSALGRYQITSATLKDMMRELGLTGDRLFDESTQDEIARALLRRRGSDPANLRNEWEGLRRVDDATIRSAYQGTATAAQQLAPTEAQQKQIDLTKQQTEARKNLNSAIQEGLSRAQFEQTLTGMSAQQKRVELELYQYIQQAKRDGITLDQNEIAAMREKITLTQQLDQKTKQADQEQLNLQQSKMFFAQQFTSSLSGLLAGTMSVTDAVKNLANSLLDAALQAMLLGQGPLAGLFGTAGGSGMLGGLFGFADGGWTGPGGKHKPAGIVHADEFVFNKRATRRLGVANLDTLHRAANSNMLPGFAEGGFVGDAPAVRRMQVPANQNAMPVQAISISAPITVNGSAGTPAQNEDLARQISKQMEGTMRGVVCDEMRRQMRPGGLANSRGYGVR